MDTQSVNQASVTNVAALSGGAILGAMVSKVLVEAVNPSDKAPDPADVDGKKAKMKKNITSTGIVILSLVGAATIKGNGNQEQFGRGAFAGMAVIQTLELFKNNITARPETSKANKLVNKAIGLGCGCDNTNTYAQLNGGYAKRRVSLRMPEVMVTRAAANSYLQNAFTAGAQVL